jgi:trehalose synthase
MEIVRYNSDAIAFEQFHRGIGFAAVEFVDQAIQRVTVGRHRGAKSTALAAYRETADGLLDELQRMAASLRGVRICHINSSASGGGVAEILAREVPLLQALGLHVDWQVIRADQEFFTITKSFHNALHGGRFHLTDEMATIYLDHCRASAEELVGEYDVFVVHDPQPAALCRSRRRRGEHWVWRCHVDSSAPDPEAWRFLRPLVEDYDAAVFTMKQFVPGDLSIGQVEIVPPAIDPLSSRNMEIPVDVCRRAVADLGIDLERPTVLQVSRFDPWKDPLGVIRAYRLARREAPGLQLVLAGMLAEDDPEGRAMLNAVEEEAGGDPDIFVITNLGNMEVNAVQRFADVVVQKSIKEGFGLVVSEALWKAKPVIAGRVGGIPMQIPPEYDRYLVDSVEECAEKIVALIGDGEERKAFGKAGQQRVREHFLLPRLVRDDLRVVGNILNGTTKTRSDSARLA